VTRPSKKTWRAPPISQERRGVAPSFGRPTGFLQRRSDTEQYNPKRFAAVIMRIREPKTTALIFASGKMVVTGAKSEDDSKLASRKYARIIQKLGFNAKFTDFKIQNIVGSCDIKFPIRLEGLASKHHNFSSYEPELFPGLIYRMIKPKIVLLIFVSGKIVLTGAKVREEIYQAFEMIYPVLQGWLTCLIFALHVMLTGCHQISARFNPARNSACTTRSLLRPSSTLPSHNFVYELYTTPPLPVMIPRQNHTPPKSSTDGTPGTTNPSHLASVACIISARVFFSFHITALHRRSSEGRGQDH